MQRKSKNKFEIHGDTISIYNEGWERVAFATIRDDYKNELMSVTWSNNNGYLYSYALKTYLHIYIMKKWYGTQTYENMKNSGFVVDHMDNNGYNCCIDNLAFLISDENKAKGMTVDKMSSNKTHIALTLYNDFFTQLKQITISFNYPAKAIISTLEKPAIVELVYLLYNTEYEIVINDARQILYDYKRDYSFAPEKLHNIDYHIEGCYGQPCSIEKYDEYIYGEHGGVIFFMERIAPIKDWTLENKQEYLRLRNL